MKLIRICFMVIAFCGAAAALRADILILKNGEKKEGTILQERPDAIRMKYKLVESGKIMDEKDFPREDIKEIIRQRPEEIEIVALRKVLPTPDLMTADQYEQVIQDTLRPFVNKYPGTAEAKEVEDMMKTLQEEKEKVTLGQLKVEGEWLSAETVKRDAYNIDGYRMRRSMNELIEAKDYIGALKEFDRLSDPAQGRPASLQYVKAIPEILAAMDAYEAVLNRMISEQPIIQKQRDDSMSRLVEPDLSRTKSAIQREIDMWKTNYEGEKKARLKWLAPYKYDIKSLQTSYQTLVAERSKLKLLDLAKLEQQNEALSNTYRFIADQNLTEADAAYKKAQAVAMKDFSKVMSDVRTKISALKSEMTKRKNSAGSFGSGSSAVAAAANAEEDDRVAKAMEEAERLKDQQKKAAEEKAAKKDEKSDTAAKEPSKPKTESSSSSDASADDEESEGGISPMLLYGAGALLVVLLVALMIQKRKKAEA